MKIIKSKYSSKELKEICEKCENMVEKDLLDKISSRQSAIYIIFGLIFLISGGVWMILMSDNNPVPVFMIIFAFLFMVIGSFLMVNSLFTHHYPEETFISRLYQKKGHIFYDPLDEIAFFEKGHKYSFASGHSMLWRLSLFIEFCEKIWPADTHDNQAEIKILRHGDMLLVVKDLGSDELRVVDGLEISNWMEEAITNDVLDFSHFDDRIEKCLNNVLLA